MMFRYLDAETLCKGSQIVFRGHGSTARAGTRAHCVQLVRFFIQTPQSTLKTGSLPQSSLIAAQVSLN